MNDWTLERYKIRHFCLVGEEDGGFICLYINTYVFIRKNALKTAELSGKRAKMRHFPYRKQNSIAEIVSTMESFLVAGVGFEPHDLRVMSPTSYQAALPRDILWCRKPGSNRYGTFVPLDFKSKASANSAIPARWHTLVSLHPCLQGLYSISPLGLFVNTYRQSFLRQAENKHCRNA